MVCDKGEGEGEGEGEGFGMFATRGIHESFHPTTPNLLYMQWCALITQYSLGTQMPLSVSGSPVSSDWWDAILPTSRQWSGSGDAVGNPLCLCFCHRHGDVLSPIR